jgi:hypothetical protein
MRVSANTDDPGYLNYVRMGGRVRVLLDGVERNGVITADEEKRMIVMVSRDESGNVKANGDEIATEVWTGNVHIEAIT